MLRRNQVIAIFSSIILIIAITIHYKSFQSSTKYYPVSALNGDGMTTSAASGARLTSQVIAIKLGETSRVGVFENNKLHAILDNQGRDGMPYCLNHICIKCANLSLIQETPLNS